MDARKSLGYKDVFLEFGDLSYKSLIARGLELTSTFGGAYFLSNINLENLAAAGLISSTQNFILRTGRLSLFGTPTLLKRATNDDEEAEILQQSRFLALIVSVPIIGIYCASGSILVLLKQESDVSLITQDFLRAFAWGVPPTLMQVSNQQFLYFRKEPWTVCLINLLQTSASLGAGYLLTLGAGKLPGLGASGLGYALSGTAWATFLGTTAFIAKHHGLFKFDFYKSLSRVRELACLGFPIALQLGSELMALTAAIQLTGLISKNALAAAEAASQWIFYVTVPMQTLSQVANILISRELKDKRLENAVKFGYCSVPVNMIIPLLSVAIFAIFGKKMASVFIHDNNETSVINTDKVTDTAYYLLIISACTQVIDAIRTGFAGSLRGYESVKIPAISGFINLCLMAVILSYIFGFTLKLGAIGIFEARIIPTLIDSLIVSIVWFGVSRDYNQEPSPVSDTNEVNTDHEYNPKLESEIKSELEITPIATTSNFWGKIWHNSNEVQTDSSTPKNNATGTQLTMQGKK